MVKIALKSSPKKKEYVILHTYLSILYGFFESLVWIIMYVKTETTWIIWSNIIIETTILNN